MVIFITFAATFSEPQVPHHISPKPAQSQGLVAVAATSPRSVYEAGNIPHDPHRDRRTRIVRPRNLGSLLSFVTINYRRSISHDLS